MKLQPGYHLGLQSSDGAGGLAHGWHVHTAVWGGFSSSPGAPLWGCRSSLTPQQLTSS